MWNCSSQQPIIANSQFVIENDINNKYNNNKDVAGLEKIDNSNNNTNSIDDRNKKKMSNGVISNINNDQINDADTYNKISSSKMALVLTPKTKKEKNSSRKSNKKEDNISQNNSENRKSEGNKSEKKKKRKKSKYKSSEKNCTQLDNKNNDNNINNNINNCSSKKNNYFIDVEEENNENVEISDSILSEIILNEKPKKISKEKKKKIKGRNNINIVILGYNEVGKSSFCIRFVENKFEDFYIPSIGVENYSKIIAYNERNYKLNFSVIWGEAKIKSQVNLLIEADFFLLIYDITKVRSFNQINLYLKQLKNFLFLYDKEGKSPNFCLAGNKSELEGERRVGLEVINKCIEKYGIKHFDISVKTAKNINSLIQFFVSIFDRIAYSNK